MGKCSEESIPSFTPGRYLYCLLNPPRVLLEDISEKLRGRTTIKISELGTHNDDDQQTDVSSACSETTTIATADHKSLAITNEVELITQISPPPQPPPPLLTKSVNQRVPSKLKKVLMNKVLKKVCPHNKPIELDVPTPNNNINVLKPRSPSTIIVNQPSDGINWKPPRSVPHFQESHPITGMFYLTSQEGNRLQLKRYNGATFETFDWQLACKENVAEGCFLEETNTENLF